METYKSKTEYLSDLEKRGDLPEGFKTSVVPITFFPVERPVKEPLPMRLSLIMLDEPAAVFAAAFTSNKCPGAPVVIGRERLAAKQISGVLINNKIANVCAQNGVEDSIVLLGHLSKASGRAPNEFFPCSTGIIGWHLPVADMAKAIPSLVSSLAGGTAVNLAKGIMTTDSFPKLRSITLGEGRIVAVAKGAGMIEPNMATMLSYIMTDISIERDALRKILKKIVAKTYNCISVDSDQSTSDTVIAMSSCRKKAVSESEFEAALYKVCSDLAVDVVRNSEGCGHVIKVSVSGAPDFDTARNVGKAVINSPLVTTAIFGNDPNVGRLASSVGDYAGNNNLNIDKEKISIKLGSDTVFEKGFFHLDQDKEIKLSNYLKERALDSDHKEFPAHNNTVDIEIELGMGTESAIVYGSDLSYGYVKENADYRS